MYFTLSPKEREEDFYNYREQLSQLYRYLNEKEKLIVIKGIRRVGKTSLMKVAYNKLSSPKVFLDGREYPYGRSLINTAFEKILAQVDPTYQVFEYLSSVEIGPFSLSLSTVPSTLKDIDNRLSKSHAYIFIDEAHMVEGLDALIAVCYDWMPRVSFVISGSEVGLMENFFTPTAPLFGRARMEITLHPLSPESAVEFLRLGFAQMGKEFKDKEISSAVENLDGLMGWLTYYGYLRRDMPHEKALEKLKGDAKLLLAAEFSKFLSKQRGEKQRYMEIVKCLRRGPLSWKRLKESVEFALKKRISPSRFNGYLKKMEASSFLVETNEGYALADPLMKLLF